MYATFDYYTGTYGGTEVASADFAHAEKIADHIIDGATAFYVAQRGIDNLPAYIADFVKMAVCAQIEYNAYYGAASVIAGDTAGSFSVGKVSVGRNAGEKASTSGAAIKLAPEARMYLEQSGLLCRAVPVLGC